MSLDVKIHDAQTAILRELLFQPQAGFAQMQKPTGLTSDHFNFHIARLVELGMVEKKARGQYTLTHKGKEYANKLDTDRNTIERQPKVAVCLVINDAAGRTLMQQRLKQPYYGWWGRPTGKVRWGETILEAAARELMEETNLTAELVFRGIYHKFDHNSQTGDLLEDKIFFMIHGRNPLGVMQQEFEGGRNQWMTNAEIRSQEHSFVDLDDPHGMNESGALEFFEAHHDFSPADY
jgi:8-oxo-dGTP diphosphatase